MLGKTSLSAIRTLVFLAQQDGRACWSPRRLAESLGESPTYLAKVVRHLVKDSILEAEKGVKGGVRLFRDPDQITLLAIEEACHGTIVGAYCKYSAPVANTCNFHRAALELHEAITEVLGRWTVADLVKKPYVTGNLGGAVTCLMARGQLVAPPVAAASAPRKTRLKKMRAGS